MSSKSQRLATLLAKVEPRREFPVPPEGASLFEIGLLCVLARRMTERQALQSAKALHEVFGDWNELRVAQIQEFLPALKLRNESAQRASALDVKEYLTEIYWAYHGFDLEPLREDRQEAVKFYSELRLLGAAAAHYTLTFALDGEPPASPPAIKCLDRLGVMPRTTSLRKATDGMRELMPEKQRLKLSLRLGEVIERWCDPRRPSCWACPLLDTCPHGKKVAKEYEALQLRLEAQRKKDEERRRKDEERARKRAEAEAKKRDRELERQRVAKARRRKAMERAKAKVDAESHRKAEIERKKVAAVKAKVAAKAALVKKAAAAKVAAAKKKVAQKKAALKQAALKQKAAKAKKKVAAKKPARSAAKKATKKPAAKKRAGKATSAKKPTAKKTAAKKPAAKKKAVKKPAAKKTAKRATTKKKAKKAAKKTSSKRRSR